MLWWLKQRKMRKGQNDTQANKPFKNEIKILSGQAILGLNQVARDNLQYKTSRIIIGMHIFSK